MAYDSKEGFERRMTVVEDMLRGLGLEAIEITPVRWVEGRPFPYNNFIYKVVLSSPALAEHFMGAGQAREPWQPCTELPPAEGVSTIIVRLSNPRALGLNNTNRVENEVAAMYLARGAVAKLGPRYTGIVPAVYSWRAAAGPKPVDEAGFGWTVMEYLTGSPMDVHFKSSGPVEKRSMVLEMAAIFSAIQGVNLPPGVDRFGGLTINDEGNIVSGQETMQGLPGGPWHEYHDVWSHQILCQVKAADGSEVIQGWRAHGIRERIEQFASTKLRNIIKDEGVDMSKLAFVHVDFTMSNMLYDSEGKRITGLVDFDWAAVTHPGHEFFTSLHDVHGSTFGQESEKLRQAILTGDFSASTDASEERHAEAWNLAKTWDDAVKGYGALRPSDISGMKMLDKLNAFIDMLYPYHLTMLEGQKAEQYAKTMADAEKSIDKVLREWGA